MHKTEPGDPESMAAAAEVAASFIPSSLTEAERRLLDWHWANLEYGCSARLSQVRQCGDGLPCQAAAIPSQQRYRAHVQRQPVSGSHSGISWC